MTEEQKLCLKAQGFKEDVKAHNVRVINAVDNKLDAYKIGRYDGYVAGYHECEKEHEWHYVKDGLPTNTGLYLIFYHNSFFNDKVRCIARYSPDRKEFLNLNIEDGDEVIAWKELPVPPKEIE
jgi:hypothetical protein